MSTNRVWYSAKRHEYVWSVSELAKRTIAQFFSTLLYNPYLSNLTGGRISREWTKNICVPGLNCYSCPAAAAACPLGSLQSFFSGAVPKFPAYVLGTMLLFGLLLGRVICGWACPFGFLQELLHKLPGPKLKKSKLTQRLSRLKYLWAVVFVLILPFAFFFMTGIGVPAFCKFICPAGTLEGAVPLLSFNPMLRSAAGWLTVWKFSLLTVFLILMIFIYRPFCRWFCPLGAFYGLLNKYALLGITVNASSCIHCGKCAAVCKMDTKIAGDHECISCGSCISSCPTQAIQFHRLSNKNNESSKT
ncbi:MAG: 4Fe-4S binding protein [Schwartzia succinivorans]|nr:4Fe-4S binding protein [Schwartzia succinivorans]